MSGPQFAPDVPSLVADAQGAERSRDRARARDLYQRALGALNVSAHSTQAAALIRGVARTHLDEGDLEAALDCCEAAAAVSTASNDEAGTAQATYLTALAHRRRGALDEAERLYISVRERSRSARQPALAAATAERLGEISALRGDARAALRHYRAALAQFRALGLREHEAPLLAALGTTYVTLRRWRSAERAYDEAAARAEGDAEARAEVEVGRATMWLAAGRIRRARETAERALERASLAGAHATAGQAHRVLAILFREVGDFARAHSALSEARAAAARAPDALLALDVEREQATLLLAQGRAGDALRVLTAGRAHFARVRDALDPADAERRIAAFDADYIAAVRAWAGEVESADPYTRGHGERVAGYAVALARAVGLDRNTLSWLRVGALLHDVGMQIVPVEVVQKPSALDDRERALVREHAAAGAALLDGVDFPWDVRPMVRGHHERWDGTGYPDGLTGEAIPLEARILAIADAYDALTSARSYRPATSRTRAIAMMSDDAERIFDPRLLAEFEALVGREGEVARLRPSGSFDRAALVAGRPLAPLPRLRDGALVADFAALGDIRMASVTRDSSTERAPLPALPLKLLCITASGIAGRADRARWLGDDAADVSLRAAPEVLPRVSAALRRLDAERYDAIVLEIGGSRTRGFEAIGRLHEHAPDTPILVIGPRGDEELAVAAVRAGAQDYLASDVATHADVLRAARCAIERLVQQNTLRGMSLIDELTGLYNRRGFYTLARQHEKLAGRLRTRMLYIFLDLDGLKQINDTFGHREGDVALVETAALLRKTFRESDVVARLGGDEFAVLALEIGGRSADTWRQRLDSNLDTLNAGWTRGYRLAVSLGVATFDPRFPRSMEDLLQQADTEMYAAKRAKGAERRLVVSEPVPKPQAYRVPDRFDAADAGHRVSR